MKIIGIIMAVMLLMLSGCAAQTNSPANVLPKTVQPQSAAAADTAEKETLPAKAANASEETSASNKITAAAEAAAAEENMSETDNKKREDKMRLLIGETEVPVRWEENASVAALRKLCPITIQMSMYGGFEQVGPLGQRIVRNDVQTRTNCGDIVLYSGNQIVIFYGSNSWAYTRLGHVDLPQQKMRELLGNGDAAITLK